MSPERVDSTIFESCMMYHPRDGAKMAVKEEDYKLLVSMGYTKSYLFQEYPKVVKHAKLGERQVNSAAEFVALGDDWEPVGYVPMLPKAPVKLPNGDVRETPWELVPGKAR